MKWKDEWSEDSFRSGRVLLLDYVSRDFTEDGRRRIFAHEFHDKSQLRGFYANEAKTRHPALRVMHIQNADWGREFVMRKFNIDPRDALIGMSFGKWAAFPAPQKRGGRPMLDGKAFRNQRDPWRGITRCAFGMDYLKTYLPGRCPAGKDGYKNGELNGWDAMGNANYTNDVYVQRLSVYVQKYDGEPKVPTDPDLRNPYNREEVEEFEMQKRRYSAQAEQAGLKDYFPILKTLDNGTTVIIFEDSMTGYADDCLIQARREIENRWRKLTLFLPKEELDEEQLGRECMNLVLSDVLKALTTSWEKYLHKSSAHVSILEEKIYDQPADESRAPELWLNSSTWLKVERLVYTHQDIIKEVKTYLANLYDTEPDEHWLASTGEDFERIEHLVQEDLVKPTDSLSDLMYKSVEIRDSRHSLELGLSMWRLSWITFIFLPLTFVVGFFGMNVDTFQNDPSIKWWFIVSVPLMALVLAAWYLVKHWLARARQDPLVRGTWEHLFHNLAVEHPDLWSRNGPRDYVQPRGRLSKLKWMLLQRWFEPSKTITAGNYDTTVDGLGAWQRCKRYLAIRWLKDIQVSNPTGTTAEGAPIILRHDGEAIELVESSSSDVDNRHNPFVMAQSNGELGAVAEAVHLASGVAMAEAEPGASQTLSPPPAHRSRASRRGAGRRRSGSGSQSPRPPLPDGRPGSQASSDGCMITEEQLGSGSEGEGEGEGEYAPPRRQSQTQGKTQSQQ